MGALVVADARASSARIVGENLAVVRHASGRARLHRPALRQALAAPLGDMACRGWAPSWLAVRRRLNKEADEADEADDRLVKLAGL